MKYDLGMVIIKCNGLKIYFNKNELFYFEEAKEAATQYADLFGCAQGQFLIKYLGISIHYRSLTNADLELD